MITKDPVTDQLGTDLEGDLVDAGLEQPQARALRRAVERAVDRMVGNFATRAELYDVRDELRAEIRDVREQLRAEVRNAISDSERKISFQLRIMWGVLALVGAGLFALMAAILARL